MSKVIERATAHFRTKIGGEMRKFHVPEWECDIWVRNSSTLKEESKVLELSQQGKTVEALIESIIVKARNEDGSKMFGPLDKQVFLNEIDPAVIIKVAGEINGVTVETAEEIEKN